MHCSQYTSQFFSTDKGHYFTDTVALFGKKQKLNHMISVTTDKQEPVWEKSKKMDQWSTVIFLRTLEIFWPWYDWVLY